MKLLDILTAPWAIVPAKLTEIQAIYATHLRGEKIDIAGIEARLGRPLANEQKDYQVVDGVAVISLEGVIAKRMNFFMRVSGGTSSAIARSQVAQAAADPDVVAILLDIDSPGGAVDGTAELAQVVFEARKEKPVVAYTDGMMCSAAYWIGSAAHRVVISGDTVQVGSIGVVASHMDVSVAEHQRGIKTTEIVAGKYKRIASQYVPLSPDGRQAIQEQVDHVYSVFVGDVAKFRGVSEETVQKEMADGRIFLGQRAIEAGLVDGVSTREGVIALAASRELLALCSGWDDEKRKRGAAAGDAAVKINIQASAVALSEDAADEIRSAIAKAVSDDPDHKAVEKGPNMQIVVGTKTIEIEGDTLTLDAAFVGSNAPEIAEAFRTEGKAAERERIAGIEKNALPGHEKIVADAKADGKSIGADVAVRIVEAERSLRSQKAGDLEKDAAKPVPGAVPPDKEASARTKEEKKAAALKAHAEAHPQKSEKNVLIDTAREHPELFRD